MAKKICVSSLEPNRMSRWAHLPEEILEMIIRDLPLEDLVRLSTVCRWFRSCVHNTMGRKSRTRYFQVELTVRMLNAQKRIENFMHWALPAWPCVLFCVDVKELAMAFFENSLEEYSTPNLWMSISQEIDDAKEIEKCQAIHVLKLSQGSLIRDVSAFGNVHTLILSGCNQISDVSMLGSVHTLDLTGCTSVTDVSKLSNVHTLILSLCHQISDVSMLGSVHTLDLTGCTSVTDVSKLSSVRWLCVMCTGVTDVSMLGVAVEIVISKCMRKDDKVLFGSRQNIYVDYGNTELEIEFICEYCAICFPCECLDLQACDDYGCGAYDDWTVYDGYYVNRL